MKLAGYIRNRWKGFADTVLRFPFTIVTLIAAVITNTITINTNTNTDPYYKLMFTFIFAAATAVVFQLLYERFFEGKLFRYIYIGITIAVSVIYYLYIKDTGWEVEVSVRISVIYFIIAVAFLWVPVIKSYYNFNDNFMAAFKSFFISMFYTGVLFLGVALIFWATDTLLFTVNEEVFLHSANIIFVLLTPIYFLSFIPLYPGRKELDYSLVSNTEYKEQESVNDKEGQSDDKSENFINEDQRNELAIIRIITPSKFLESLISYVIIPITALFTIILLLYIVTNITGDFWTDNLMEPLLVIYSITVIIVYLLAAVLKNKLAIYFRKLFPKVLVPVVLFQTISSILKIGDMGITYGRYYVIMFGLFATIAGIWFCIKPVEKNGMIAPILLLLSVISILPPIDSFTISRVNQTERLKNVLENNDMLEENTIRANQNLPAEDREVIISSVQYLDRLDYTKDIPWLASYHKSLNFEKSFGFSEYEQVKEQGRNVYITRERFVPITIEGYHYFFRANIYYENKDMELGEFMLEDRTYTLKLVSTGEYQQDLLLSDGDTEIIRLAMSEIYGKFTDETIKEITLPTEELTFTRENQKAAITVIADNLSINEWDEVVNQQADLYVLIKIK